MKKKTNNDEFWCEAVGPENEIKVFKSAEDLVSHIEYNGPCVVGKITLNKKHAKKAKEILKDKDISCVGFPLSEYRDLFDGMLEI